MWQELLGRQATPAVQATQAPAEHTMFVPHAVPFGRLPVGAHTGVPVLHEVAPLSQTFAGVHAPPALQVAWHTWRRQT